MIVRLCVVLVALATIASSAPSVYYQKEFPGSVPAWVSVEVQSDGKSVYKEAVDDEDPISFKLQPEVAAEIFSLAEKLDRFKRPLESELKVAQMGRKTFRWVDGAEKHEQHFNYSLDETAKALLEWFEKITETQRLYFDLERTVRFDKLGVNRTVILVHSALERNRLVASDRFLPLLDRVAKNDAYLNMARERAANVADLIRNPRPSKPAE